MRNDRGIWAVKVPATLGGSQATVFSASCRLCGWSILDQGSQPVVDALSVAIAAAAAGALTLTGFKTVQSVTVTPAAAWPAGVNQVTVTNLQGGTLTVDIPGGTTNAVFISFSPSISTTADPVVSVPAIVGGPAYTIQGVGTINAAIFPELIAVGQFLDGSDKIGVTVPVTGRTDTQWLGDRGIYVGNALIFSVSTGLLSGVAYIRDAYDPEAEQAWPGHSYTISP
jgi:hypothetical protein